MGGVDTTAQHADDEATASISYIALNNAAASSLDGSAASGQTPCYVLLDQAWRGTQHLVHAFRNMQRPCFGIPLLQVSKPPQQYVKEIAVQSKIVCLSVAPGSSPTKLALLKVL